MFLVRNYYFQDNVSSVAGGERLRPQFQKRGLRQGNLNAVFFIIYLSELGRRMRLSSQGTQLPSGELVYISLFADDIIIISNSEVDLLALKSILKLWCKDFGMKISAEKSNIISPDVNISCMLSDLSLGETDCLARWTTTNIWELFRISRLGKLLKQRVYILWWKRRADSRTSSWEPPSLL